MSEAAVSIAAMSQGAQARVWWAEVEDVRERIERKRERERQVSVHGAAPRRAVREVRPGHHLTVVRAATSSRQTTATGDIAPGRLSYPRSRRPAAWRIGSHPDRVAAWAVVLGFALVLAAMLSAH